MRTIGRILCAAMLGILSVASLHLLVTWFLYQAAMWQPELIVYDKPGSRVARSSADEPKPDYREPWSPLNIDPGIGAVNPVFDYLPSNTCIWRLEVTHWTASGSASHGDHPRPIGQTYDGSVIWREREGVVVVGTGERPHSEGRPTLENIKSNGSFSGWLGRDFDSFVPIIYLCAAMLAAMWRFRGILMRAMQLGERAMDAGKRLSDKFDQTVEEMNTGSRR